MRSRLLLVALAGALCLLAACTSHFGPGLAELAADRGWRPLPIGSWVVNDGLEPRSIVYCPGEPCLRPAMAALIVAEGGKADELERALAADPARLAREFAKPAAKPDKAKKPAKPAKPSVKSATSVSRFRDGGTSGLLVTIRGEGETGRLAATAILYGRDAGKLVLAIAVSNDADAARGYARAAWHSR
jgi:hypothetical protein